jgi:hypothetical protein
LTIGFVARLMCLHQLAQVPQQNSALNDGHEEVTP